MNELEKASDARSIFRHRLRASVLALVAMLLLAQGALASTAAARLDFPERSDFLVLSYSVHHEELAENDPQPLVRIFGDGTVRVHIPRYMRGAGDFSLTLGEERLRALLNSFDDLGLMTFDAATLKAQVQHAESERQARQRTFIAISDTSWTSIHIHLDGYQPTASSVPGAALDQIIRWPNIAWHAEHYPEVPQLRHLAAAETELRALLTDPNLTAVEP